MNLTGLPGRDHDLTAAIGPVWSGLRLRRELGLASKQALDWRRRSGSIFGIKAAGGQRLYPLSQFRRQGNQIEVKPGLVAMFRTLRRFDSWAVAQMLHTPEPELEDMTPLDWDRNTDGTVELRRLATRIAQEWRVGGNPDTASTTSSKGDAAQPPPSAKDGEPIPARTSTPTRRLTVIMYREHADHPASTDHGCWQFASIRPGEEPTSRFDRFDPHGTCYLSETIDSAVRDRCGRFLSRGLPIPSGHIAERVLSTIRTSQRLAMTDLTDPDIGKSGVIGYLTASDLTTGDDYRLTTAWAEALGAAGYDGAWYQGSSPPQGGMAAIFGPASSQDAIGTIESTVNLADELKRLGYTIAVPPSAQAFRQDDDADPADL